MTDTTGYRGTLGVVLSAANTALEPELYTAAPDGYGFHSARLAAASQDIGSDAALDRLQSDMRSGLDAAVAQLLPLEPDHVIVGLSLAPFEGGPAGHEAFASRLETGLGCRVTTTAGALLAAVRALDAASIALLTPLGGAAARTIEAYFAACGIEVRATSELTFATPRAIGRASRSELATELRRLAGKNVDAVVQLGTNLPALPLLEPLEELVSKPVVGVNSALLWHALRALGDTSAIHGYGRLLKER